MALPDLTGQNIQDTYQRVIHTDGTSTYDGTGSLLPIEFSGDNVLIAGSLTAQTYVVSESITNVSSGSTIFGNSLDDTHQITGSLNITGSNITSSANFKIGNRRPHLNLFNSQHDTSLEFEQFSLVSYINFNSSIHQDLYFRSSASLNQLVLDGGSGRVSVNTIAAASQFHVQGDATITSNVTASENISASKEVQAAAVRTKTIKASSLDIETDSGTFGWRFTADSDPEFTTIDGGMNVGGTADFIHLDNNVTASGTIKSTGDISSSGNIYGSSLLINSQPAITPSGGDLLIGDTTDTTFSTIQILGDNLLVYPHITASGNIKLNGHLTGSGGIVEVKGDVSASGNITAQTGSFESMNLAFGGKITMEDASGNNNDVIIQNLADTLLNVGDSDIDTYVVGNKVQLTSEDDIFFDSGQNDIHFMANGTTGITFKVDSNEITFAGTHGDLLINPTTFNTRFDSNITSSGHVKVSGSGTAGIYLETTGNITASGTISASSDVHSSRYFVDSEQLANLDGDVMMIGTAAAKLQSNAMNVKFTGPITASGLISQSGASGQNILSTNLVVYGRIQSVGSDVTIENGHISASGNISSSGMIEMITGSFAHIVTDSDTIQFRHSASKATEGYIKFDTTDGLSIIDASKNPNKIKVDHVSAVSNIKTGAITASGQISASDNIYGKNLFLRGKLAHDGSILYLEQTQSLRKSDNRLILDPGGVYTGVEVLNNITASGNVSASHFIAHNEGLAAGYHFEGSDSKIILHGDNTIRAYSSGISADLQITASAGILNKGLGGATGSSALPGTQGWANETGSYSVISIPPTEFNTDDNSSTRYYGGWVRGIGGGYVRAPNGGVNYFASYVIPKGHKVVGGAVYATAGTYRAYHGAVFNVADNTQIQGSTAVNTSAPSTTTTIEGLIDDTDSWTNVYAYPGAYLTIMWDPNANDDSIGGALIILETA